MGWVWAKRLHKTDELFLMPPFARCHSLAAVSNAETMSSHVIDGSDSATRGPVDTFERIGQQQLPFFVIHP